MALPKANRVKSKKDFDLVFKKGNAVKGNFLFIKSRENNSSMPRFGLIIPAKIIAGSAARNRLKRVILEEVRKRLNKKPGGRDIIILLNKKAEEDDIIRELADLLDKK